MELKLIAFNIEKGQAKKISLVKRLLWGLEAGQAPTAEAVRGAGLPVATTVIRRDIEAGRIKEILEAARVAEKMKIASQNENKLSRILLRTFFIGEGVGGTFAKTGLTMFVCCGIPDVICLMIKDAIIFNLVPVISTLNWLTGIGLVLSLLGQMISSGIDPDSPM